MTTTAVAGRRHDLRALRRGGHARSSRALDGVRSVEVVLETGQVTVDSDRPLEPAAVAAAVEEAGYQLA